MSCSTFSLPANLNEWQAGRQSFYCCCFSALSHSRFEGNCPLLLSALLMAVSHSSPLLLPFPFYFPLLSSEAFSPSSCHCYTENKLICPVCAVLLILCFSLSRFLSLCAFIRYSVGPPNVHSGHTDWLTVAIRCNYSLAKKRRHTY